QGNNRIRKIGTNGLVSTFAGSTAGYRDGVGTNAQFNAPSGLAIDANDNVYVADSLNQRIRIINSDGLVSTFSGTYGTPIDIAFAKDGTLFIADSAGGAIREISTNGVVSAFATGVPDLEHLALDATGGVYAATSMGTLLKLNPDGTTAWSVGDGLGYRDGLAALARFVQVGRPLLLADGSLIVGDYYHLRQITFGIPPLVLINPGGGLFTNSITVTLETSVADGVIRYTLDGTTPGTNSAIYTPGPTNSLTLSNSAALAINLQAVVFVNQYPVSQVTSVTFTNAFNAWLAQYFGPNYATNAQATATADPDGDGSNNYQEFLDGTSPLDPKSVKIHVTARIVPLITWNSVSNQAYRVYRKDDPSSTNAVVVAPSVVATNTTTSYIDLSPDLNAFYWIELLTNAPVTGP
ncbi:MAG: chitobiase/beta-hexosaminidase C-terminal domain-containing protein, partial [Verrucomicrobia bacterium]|nr:chitobiase/beta-hexosaminidase C-terminal domain-containing protein [Verrucomicrobiota bacterium]